MKVKDIYNAVNEYAPFGLAYSWDNVGLLVGNMENDVSKVLITLDTDASVVREAIDNGCDLILSHHPVFFSPVKRILTDNDTGRMIELMMKHGISLIAAHTNMDVTQGGINDKLAELFELQDVEILEENPVNPACGLGRIGNLKAQMSIRELCAYTKQVLDINGVRLAGNPDAAVKRIAVAGGSCSEIIPLAYAKGAQAVITGDMKYHDTIDKVNIGINIIDAGHYGTEINVLELFEKAIANTGIKSVRSENKDIFTFM